MASSMISIQDAPIKVLILMSGLCAYETNAHAPKVDQTKDHSGDDGKVGKVETEGSPRGD